MKRFFLVLSAVMLLALGACQKAPELTVTGPTSIDMSADGSSGTITFTANRDWTVSCSESWVHVSPTSGAASDGPVTVSVKCDANTTYDDRTATVTIRAEDLTQSVTVKQPQNLGVIVPTQTFDIKADTKSIEVEVQANMEYTVSVSADWIKQSGTKALTSKKLTFSIEENTTYDAREGRITIKPQSGAEQVISVKQQAKDGLELGSTIYEVGVSGGTLEIALKTNVELEVTPGADWIHYTETKALDNRTVILSIDPNDSDAERSGEVKISQKGGTLSSTVTVKQEKPVLTVEKTEYTVGPDGGTLEIAVQTNVEFEVKPDADWIHYTETKALSDKTVVLAIDKNGGTDGRSGAVKISQKGGTLSIMIAIAQFGIPEGAVDLGLSVLWAECNLGASRPEESGDYFAWGETEPKDDYTWETYKWGGPWRGSSSLSLTKYSRSVDQKEKLEPDDDAAHVNLGGNWRMPTLVEIRELINRCKWEWTDDYNGTGVRGVIVTSRVEGYTDKSIFFPARLSDSSDAASRDSYFGSYWASTLGSYSENAFYLYFNYLRFRHTESIRWHGRFVRPVLKL